MTVSFAEGLVGITLDDRYRLDAVLGEGGMGAVFRATHLAMDRRVAVKMLKPHLSSNEASLQRFLREARSTMKVDSPHAVKVLDYGVTPHRDYYMVLEYLDGRTVQRELDVDGVFSPARVLHIARQCLHALGAAHATGLVHRDLKPENILLMTVGQDHDYTKLLDFGVAKLMEGAARSDQSQLALTQIGTVFGTPEFMSPEQACGHDLDGRSDLYSLGATMFAMLTGCGLFEAGSAIEWLTNHVRTPPPHLADVRPELASYPELDRLLQRCLAKHREQRPSSAQELDRLLAKLEHSIATRTPVPATTTAKARVFSSSMFFDALPAENHDPGETLARAAPVESAAQTAPRTSTKDLLAQVQPRRGRLALGIVALGVLAAGAVVVGIGLSRGSGSSTVASTPGGTPADAPALGPIEPRGSVDAPVAPDAPAAHAAPEDAGAPPPVDAGVKNTRPPPPRLDQAKLAEHLKTAEEGLRTGNVLKQLGGADLALQIDPKHPRARYLMGDALIKGSDLERGCTYLRSLGKNPLAVSRATSAGCPD